MTVETFTVAQAKHQFPAIVADVEATDSVVGITSRGRVVAVVLSAADYRELTEVVPGFGGSASAQIDESAARRALESEVVRRHARILAEHVGKEPLS